MVGNVDVVVAVVSDLAVAHTAAAVHRVEGDNAVAAVAALEEMKGAEGMTARLAEVQSTVVDLADGLLSVNTVYESCQRDHSVPYPPFSGGAYSVRPC